MLFNIKEKNPKNLQLRIDILKEVAIFSNSDEKIRKRLATSLIDVDILKDEPVFLKGDTLNAMYIIAKGEVKVHDGDHIFTKFKEKDFFGEYSLIDSSVIFLSIS